MAIRKEYLEIPYGSLRSTVEPSFAERSLIKHSEYFSNGRLITSPAVDITESQVLVANGRHVDFDFLVVATGHDHPLPTTRDLRLQHYRTGKFISLLFQFSLFGLKNILQKGKNQNYIFLFFIFGLDFMVN